MKLNTDRFSCGTSTILSHGPQPRDKWKRELISISQNALGHHEKHHQESQHECGRSCRNSLHGKIPQDNVVLWRTLSVGWELNLASHPTSTKQPHTWSKCSRSCHRGDISNEIPALFRSFSAWGVCETPHHNPPGDYPVKQRKLKELFLSLTWFLWQKVQILTQTLKTILIQGHLSTIPLRCAGFHRFCGLQEQDCFRDFSIWLHLSEIFCPCYIFKNSL